MKKKLVSYLTIIAVIITFCMNVHAYASNENILADSSLIDPIVGELTIFASNDGGSSAINISGHAFLMFKNVSSSAIKIGGLTVAANKTITFGTWGNKSQHTGIWYNLESYLVIQQGAYSNRVSLTTYISESQISSLNSLISSNDKWSLTNNCSSFAVKIWNTFSSKSLDAGTVNTPTNLIESIKDIDGYETTKSITASVPIGYVENGSFVSVSSSSITSETEINMISVYDNLVFTEEIDLNPNSMEVDYEEE